MMIERVTLSDQIELSRIVYGMWRILDDDNTSASHITRKIEVCLEQGITSLDQADIYGGYQAEAALGAALRANPGLRDHVEIITKCGIIAPVGKYADRRVTHYNTSEAHITASVEASLTNLATDRIDLLLIHRPDPFMDHEETGRALDNLVSSGKVRAVGVSNFKKHDWSLLQSAMSTKLVTNQIEISVLHHSPFLDGDIAWMQEQGLHPMAWSPLGGGALFETKGQEVRQVLERIAQEQKTDITAVAVDWLLAHPVKLLPVMGTNRIDRIATLSSAADIQMDRETWFEILTAAMGHGVP
jgi:predicted oxidoreductase